MAFADCGDEAMLHGTLTSENLETSPLGKGCVSVGMWLIQMLTRSCRGAGYRRIINPHVTTAQQRHRAAICERRGPVWRRWRWCKDCEGCTGQHRGS